MTLLVSIPSFVEVHRNAVFSSTAHVLLNCWAYFSSVVYDLWGSNAIEKKPGYCPNGELLQLIPQTSTGRYGGAALLRMEARSEAVSENRSGLWDEESLISQP